jgi:large subunit ribosomal protein L29
MKIQELREMSTEELVKRIEEEERNAVDLRFAHKLKQLTNTAKLKTTKKDISRMKTLLRERNVNSGKAEIKEGAKA